MPLRQPPGWRRSVAGHEDRMRSVLPRVVGSCYRAPRMSNPDVQTIDALMKAVYECVTVAPGAPRQWERERELYRDGALLIADRAAGMTRYTLEEWIAQADPILAQGFVEYEIA